ncbi:hypothetical protein EUTSA_v10000657mg [Eutrema salsugineum]|uniref:RING-type E3 ubiquitin transferase n=1 Tax=Eutrema salsugineum TaxID=72664 RepID=V4LQU5_EUTSA|nr:E3 ubiquitin-protein ligase ORTHRUS 2 [Eutrema salsugineum]ESQ46164.1 hypothetical protein EUTSA_v10000657mg [Eutrema salsugineum]
MNPEIQVPCDADGSCMRCKSLIPPEECLNCSMCATPWHVACLRSPPETLALTQSWECPDCCGVMDLVPVSGLKPDGEGSSLVAAIRAIQADESLTEAQKAKKRQQLLSGKADEEDDDDDDEKIADGDDVLAAIRINMNCTICKDLLERPVTTPCGHNICLKCFEKWLRDRNVTCPDCRFAIPRKIRTNPRINSALVAAIRLAKVSKTASVASTRVYHHISNQDRPEKAFTTDRAKKTGKANACSGRIYVTIPPDHFGPIPAENDPVRNQGVLVGETWEDRQECKQWGAHNPHVSGIAGQSDYGAQSVCLSGGYKDDEDHGEWFLYTGSGGRDLSGNKRTNKKQSFDQEFTKFNEALRLSCKQGYPVRVVRSDKEKRSAYAPAQKGVRYDGVYRIEKCWRKIGIQGSFKVCRYLFVRCDNEPAPWTSDEHGDRPRPLPHIPELENATDLFVRKESPSWDFDEADGRWKWVKSPPASRKAVNSLDPAERKIMKGAIRAARNKTTREKLLKEFSCLICRKLMNLPVTTPCAHNFCKACLTAKFAGISQLRERSSGGRTLRAQKNVMNCPSCPTDISDFLQNPEVNRELASVIENLNKKVEEEPVAEKEESGESSGGGNTESEEEEEETQIEDEPPTKKMKLDTEAVAPMKLDTEAVAPMKLDTEAIAPMKLDTEAVAPMKLDTEAVAPIATVCN